MWKGNMEEGKERKKKGQLCVLNYSCFIGNEDLIPNKLRHRLAIRFHVETTIVRIQELELFLCYDQVTSAGYLHSTKTSDPPQCLSSQTTENDQK